ncbi:hypothetical protein TTE2434 [Caldanaerobacter subterraneus subsp. tengcongensis MB4]|uniref:Uncharacterized protein n=1 Tax=Caldanaerobacter subterraneus subsp. tengcongensis (strain DSM 15242 / JCM 11007 / NBRC 100824 / MB4) TaxID=273068 RepID=Q8R7H4_CALS4|nr:hypothetical protein TTE2434 [Caldanaerobacter subterraneus subsp. tengcongensis MB4]
MEKNKKQQTSYTAQRIYLLSGLIECGVCVVCPWLVPSVKVNIHTTAATIKAKRRLVTTKT